MLVQHVAARQAKQTERHLAFLGKVFSLCCRRSRVVQLGVLCCPSRTASSSLRLRNYIAFSSIELTLQSQTQLAVPSSRLDLNSSLRLSKKAATRETTLDTQRNPRDKHVQLCLDQLLRSRMITAHVTSHECLLHHVFIPLTKTCLFLPHERGKQFEWSTKIPHALPIEASSPVRMRPLENADFPSVRLSPLIKLITTCKITRPCLLQCFKLNPAGDNLQSPWSMEASHHAKHYTLSCGWH